MNDPILNDTIAAIATPMGRAGIGVVRLSGPSVEAIAVTVLGVLPAPRQATRRPFRTSDGELIDDGIAIYYPAPWSYTGESVLELQGHGGQVVMDLLLEETLHQGARLANPGEFTYRAFMNDKLDLAQSEAVADIIDAQSRQALKSAQRTVRGDFSIRVAALVTALTQLRVELEASLDFADEDIETLGQPEVRQRITYLHTTLAKLIDQARQGCLLREGVRIVIAGRTNVGKSSLMNCLSGDQVAIVTDRPGTTRDLLKEHLTIAGLPVQLVDTAGIRDAEDEVEQLGIGLAKAAVESADLVILVEEDTATPALPSLQPGLAQGVPLLVVRNKIDLTSSQPAVSTAEHVTTVWASALTGNGIDLVRAQLQRLVGYRPGGEGAFIARRRHIVALEAAFDIAAKLTSEATSVLSVELLAEDLRQMQQLLGQITGEFTNEDLLAQIFSSFCIGK